MRIKVNPNRMMLIRLKQRLELARRGHKLLKNKQEKLMQNFFALVSETTALRAEVEKSFMDISVRYLEGRAATDRQTLEDALALSTRVGELEVAVRHEMNISSPAFSLRVPERDLAYPLATAHPSLDEAFEKLFAAVPGLLDLAGKEHTLFRMADELEKTRRRVNALEYVLIPDLESVIRSIDDKLSEQERSNQIRLMKIKDMVKERSTGL